MTELTLEELLADPLVKQLMSRDGLVELDVRAVMSRAKDGLKRLRRLASDCSTRLDSSPRVTL